MHFPRLEILDVGHGNSAVLLEREGVAVFDCPQGGTLLEALENTGVREVDFVLVSHADEDHVAGLIALLCHEGIAVRRVYINPDARKRTRVWTAVRIALEDAYQRRGTRAILGIHTQMSGELRVGDVNVDILAPTLSVALSGPGGEDVKGELIDSNSASVVVGLTHDSHRIAVLAGDIDERALRELEARYEVLPADVLVFPHHGGRAGRGDNKAFAAALCRLTVPKLVVFSLGRGKFDNPRQDVIEGVVEGAPEAHIMCTELSGACAKSLPDHGGAHLMGIAARGLEDHSCCGGSIRVTINGDASQIGPATADHLVFIGKHAPTARCIPENR